MNLHWQSQTTVMALTRLIIGRVGLLWITVVWPAFVTLLIATPIVHASGAESTSNPVDREAIRETVGGNRAPLSAPFMLPAVPKDPADSPVETDGQRYRIRQIKLRGNTVFPEAVLADLAKPYLDRPIGALEIEELRQLLTRQYVNRGYLTSGALVTDPVDADASLLDFTIIEGRVGQVRIEGLGRLSERYVADRLVPDPKSVLNIEQLRERYELLLSDPLFNTISTRLTPGIERGSSVLFVDVTRAVPYQFSVFSNNYTAPSIGESALGVSGLVRNFTGYGDTLSINAQGPSNGFKVNRYGLNWLVPVNSLGTQVSLQVDEGASSVIESSVAALDIRSQLSSAEFGIVQAVINNTSGRLAYGLARSRRRNETSLLGAPFSFAAGIPDGVLIETAWKFWQDFIWRNESTVIAARITRNQVENNLLPDSVDPGAQPPDHYGYWITQITLGRRLTDSGIQAQARATFQNSSTHLTSLDRFGIGGAMTVRGYRENQLLRDTGAIINLETDIPVLNGRGANAVQLGVTPFFAWGRGKNIGETGLILSSTGLALRSEWRGFIANLALAKRLIRPSSVDTLNGTIQDKGIHFQLLYNL